MHLIPTNDEVIALLRRTGALRDGHFEDSNGLHSNEFLEVPMAFRYFETAKILSVGLSRCLRRDTEMRAMIKDLSIVSPTTGGLPIAYGVAEALRVKQVYWAEGEANGGGLHFRRFIRPEPGEKVLMVDDILRSGRRFTQLKKLIEDCGGHVVGMAVGVYQPNPNIADFGSLPRFFLAQMDARYYKDAASCDFCKRGIPLEKLDE